MQNLFKKKRKTNFVEPDEIFLDSKNLPLFDRQQFEGRIETSIKKRTIFFTGLIFCLIFLVFTVKLFSLQVKNGDDYNILSMKNSLSNEPIFATRGVIYDRIGEILAWNEGEVTLEEFAKRRYTNDAGFSHILGYVSYPLKDKSGNFWREEYLGRDGVEDVYNDILSGINGKVLTERDVLGKKLSESKTINPISGENVTLSLDARINHILHENIAALAKMSGYVGGAGIIMDVKTGELIALTSFPEYDNNFVSSDSSLYQKYITDSRKPFLNRAISGLYTPGSIVKPYVALSALSEGVITPETMIASHGSITIPNVYSPENPSIFSDYRPDNGVVDLRHALAVSSNIYFYNISGGYKSQKGVGITKIKEHLSSFGIGNPTGIILRGEAKGLIPDPAWKKKTFKGDPWRLGDTYNTAIGQYGFQVTPIQMARAISAIANGGNVLMPQILKTDEPIVQSKIEIKEEHLDAVKDGMRMAVTYNLGTGVRLNQLKTPVAVKSGTAEVGISKKSVNSWTTLFFPYDHPRYALVITMERAPGNPAGAVYAAYDTMSWIEQNTPEYVK